MPLNQHEKILIALRAWIAQRPGLDPRDYGDGADAWRGYRQESARIGRQLKDARAMLAVLDAAEPLSAEVWADAFRAYSGRLTWDADKGALSYCTGQYYPTEYRAAACAVMASALWSRDRAGMPAARAYIVRGYSAWNGDTFVKGTLLGTYATEAEAYAARGAESEASVSEVYGTRETSAGDFLRAGMRNRFGARLQNARFS